MSLLEFNLENPAYKRVTQSDTDEEGNLDAEAAAVEATEEPADADGSSRRRPMAVVALLAAIVAALAIRRRRS